MPGGGERYLEVPGAWWAVAWYATLMRPRLVFQLTCAWCGQVTEVPQAASPWICRTRHGTLVGFMLRHILAHRVEAVRKHLGRAK